MDADIARILLHRDTIRMRVAEMAREIAGCYGDAGRKLTLVPILSGSIIFLADLMRELPLKMRIALVHVSTYRGETTQPGTPELRLDLTGEIEGADVLIVDDILDSGRTLAKVQRMARGLRPASVRAAVLLRKPHKASGVEADFVGFDIEDSFVVGYGLDYNNLYRNYPHIGILRSSACMRPPLEIDAGAVHAAAAEAGAADVIRTARPIRMPVLDGGEIIELSIKPSLWAIAIVSARVVTAMALLTCSLAFAVAGVWTSLALAAAASSPRPPPQIAASSLHWASRVYVLTNRRVLVFSGVLRIQVQECPLVRIGVAEMRAEWYDRALALGTLAFSRIGEATPAMYWEYVSNPAEVYTIVQRSIRRAHSGDA